MGPNKFAKNIWPPIRLIFEPQNKGGQMATLNELGNITARCPGCKGALASFLWQHGGNKLGVVSVEETKQSLGSRTSTNFRIEYRLFRCGGCGMGALGTIKVQGDFPCTSAGLARLQAFYPEANLRYVLPPATPKGIAAEFQEGEKCLEADCLRAAAAMFRSVLDKTLRANGYKLKKGTPLEQQIDKAAEDGVITAARKRRAHDEIRTLGNDVLHDEWREVSEAEVLTARQYAYHLLHDFYDDRETVLGLLREKGRVAAEDQPIDPPENPE